MSFEAAMRGLGGLVAWGALAVLMFGIWQGTKRAPGRSSGRAAVWLRSAIFYAFALAVFLAFSIWGWRPLPIQIRMPYRLLVMLAGSLLYFLGVGFILWGRMTLGRMYFVSTSMGA